MNSVRSDASPTVSGMTTVTKTCSSCGGEVKLSLPKGELAQRWARAIGVLCETCAAEQESQEAELSARKRRESAEAACGLPKAKRGFLWAEMIHEPERMEAIEAAQRWSEGSLRHLLLCGPTGTGKTRLAATALWDRVQQGEYTTYMKVPRLIAMERAGFRTAEKDQATKHLVGHGALVLDDLDKVPSTEAVRSLLYLAIDNRIEAESPLLVTTNLRPEQITDAYGEAIASRLRGACEVCLLTGVDRRMTNAT